VDHVCVKFGDPSCIRFEISRGKTDRQRYKSTIATDCSNYMTTVSVGKYIFHSIIRQLLLLLMVSLQTNFEISITFAHSKDKKHDLQS